MTSTLPVQSKPYHTPPFVMSAITCSSARIVRKNLGRIIILCIDLTTILTWCHKISSCNFPVAEEKTILFFFPFISDSSTYLFNGFADFLWIYHVCQPKLLFCCTTHTIHRSCQWSVPTFSILLLRLTCSCRHMQTHVSIHRQAFSWWFFLSRLKPSKTLLNVKYQWGESHWNTPRCNFSGFMSIPIIRDAPAVLAPSTT